MDRRIVIFLLVFVVGSVAGVVGYSSARITTFEECENSWLVRTITHYDYAEYIPNAIEKECVLWGGRSFTKQTTQELTSDQKRAVEIAIAHLSFPVTVVEVKELGCYGCFSITLQRNDVQHQFATELNDWKIVH